MISQALIPAAGRGVRAYPKSRSIPKVLFEIDGKPLIERNIELLRDYLGIRDITIIVGYAREQIVKRLGDGNRLRVSLRYIQCSDPDVGLAKGLLLARTHFRQPFVTVLGDELYLESNHGELPTLFHSHFDAICGILYTSDLHQIKQNYGVRLENGRIVSLIEKPTVIENNWLGCGTYVFTPRIFEAIEATPRSPRTGKVELTDAINTLASGSSTVRPFFLKGSYFNINTIDDYHYAQYRVRASRFPQYTVSVVIPAYNEEQSIGHVVRDFKPWVHEVLVVNNSSTDRTAARAAEAGARVETVRLHGYGDTIRHGLDCATGDILVIVEGDYSFRSRDLNKLLEYLKDADMVIGTRTTRELIEQGTNMRGPVRWGNVFVAKLIEALWWAQQPRFTDVGCTYRALWKDTYFSIRPLLTTVGPEFSPEMMMAALQAGKRVIEVPVSYHRRLGGESKHSSNYRKIFRTALRMLWTIARKRLGG